MRSYEQDMQMMDQNQQSFFKNLINSPKLKQREDLAHSFVVVGMPTSENIKNGGSANDRSFTPQIIDYYPEIFEDKSQG